MTNETRQITIEIKCLMNERKIYNTFMTLPKHAIVDLQKILSKARKDKYDNRSSKKYGNLPRNLNAQQLEQFFKTIYRKETRRIFLIQFYYGLRIGEIGTIEYLQPQKLIKIYNQKCDRIDYLPVHGETYKLFEKPIILPHLDNLRGSFNQTIKRMGLEFRYYKTRQGSELRQFTTHSLRHSAITLFMNYIKDPLKGMKFSRHANNKQFGSLPVYCNYSLDEMRTDLEQTFKPLYYLIDKAI